jgi:hypothetical protein
MGGGSSFSVDRRAHLTFFPKSFSLCQSCWAFVVPCFMIAAAVDAFELVVRAVGATMVVGAFPALFLPCTGVGCVSISIAFVALGDLEVGGILLHFEALPPDEEAVMDTPVCSLSIFSEYND